MDLSTSSPDLARVKALLTQCGAADAKDVYPLCDRHEASEVAYRIVDSNLQIDQITFGELKRTYAARAYFRQIHVVQTRSKLPRGEKQAIFSSAKTCSADQYKSCR
jgi:hypothetical protein